MLKKVFNWSEVHLSEMTCYKIYTLNYITKIDKKSENKGNIALATIMKINFDQVICYYCSTFAEIGMIHIICLNKLVCCLQLDLLDKKCKKLHHMKLLCDGNFTKSGSVMS